MDIGAKVTAGMAGIGPRTRDGPGHYRTPVADGGGGGASASTIKRCLSESNPVKRGVSGRMMRNLFNEVCQQSWGLKAENPRIFKSDLLTPEQGGSNTAVTTEGLQRRQEKVTRRT